MIVDGERIQWVVMDRILFSAAKEQLGHYHRMKQGSGVGSDLLVYWEIAYAGASILLVCAAMEAHANYLLDRAARNVLPNRLHLSVDGVEHLQRNLRPVAKWLLASVAVCGRQVLDPGRPPLQGFHQAVTIRNRWLAHPKLGPRAVPKDAPPTEDHEFREVRELTVDNAERAIIAAKNTVREVYEAMGHEAPDWARDCQDALPP